MNRVLKTFYIWRRKADYCRRDICAFLGLTDSSFKAARGARIVVYHGICQHQPLRFNNIFLTRATFEAHLQFYQKYFNVVSLDDYYHQRFSPHRFNICLHFDDGYANNHTYVLPLLEQYRVPATFFITAVRAAGYDILWNDFLGILSKYGPQQLVFRQETFYKQRARFSRYVSASRGIGLWEMLRSEGFESKARLLNDLYPLAPFRENPQDTDYWLQMTPQQIKELASSPWVTIGAHGYYHNDLPKIPLPDAEKEMFACRQYLEDIIGKPVKAFAFPYGTYTPAVVEAAKRAGFSQLLPLNFHFPESAADPAQRERVIINPYVSVTNQQFNLIKRRYDFWR
ncbi:polysaccharide deacetylase family protein [Puia dinghuensis]|uniref:NodB homology domain-containing protein n=1 Tax=Puia dinghuensis TaxID=1792502 RepID=A0A8J2XT23_9BACT|nr:polysaccharide deacetylase family protein [Puia dinghuensis]GGA99914.1 hypothetical protein GCM10011511_24030 [Puia dinghuensis]